MAVQFVSASEQTAIVEWVKRHWVTVAVEIGGLVSVLVLAYRNGVSITPLGFLALIPLIWVARYVLGVLWWMHRHRRLLAKASMPAPGFIGMWSVRWQEKRRIAYVRKQWEAYCEGNKILGWGKVVPKLHKLQANADGDLTALVSPGPINVKGGVNRIRQDRLDIAEVCGCPNMTVREVGVGHAILTFLWTDEFERDLPIQRLPLAPKGRIAYGIHRDGSVASLDPNKSTLVAGVQGSGKSSMVWTILSHWLRTGEWVDLYVIDPKGGQEWGWLLRMATIAGCRVKVKGFAKDEASAIKMLNQALERVKKRQLENGEVDLEDWSKDPVRQVVPTENEPRIVILADELLHLRKALKDTPTAPSPFGQFISIGRSAAASVIAVSQDATKDTVGMVRDLFGQRVALRTASPTMTNMVLADGAEARGATCSKIPESTPGIGFAYDDDQGVEVEVRIAHVKDSDIKNDIQYGRAPEGMLSANGEASQIYLNYRFYTTDRQPLRTGITNNFERRYAEYRAAYEKERLAIEAGYLNPAKALHQWFPYHDPAQTIVTEASSKAEAKRVESDLIATGVWRGNHQENMHSPLRNVPPPVEPTHHWWQREPKPPTPQSVPADELQLNTNVTPIRRRPPEKKTTRRRTA